jgi:hypothetical protein
MLLSADLTGARNACLTSSCRGFSKSGVEVDMSFRTGLERDGERCMYHSYSRAYSPSVLKSSLVEYMSFPAGLDRGVKLGTPSGSLSLA